MGLKQYERILVFEEVSGKTSAANTIGYDYYAYMHLGDAELGLDTVKQDDVRAASDWNYRSKLFRINTSRTIDTYTNTNSAVMSNQRLASGSEQIRPGDAGMVITNKITCVFRNLTQYKNRAACFTLRSGTNAGNPTSKTPYLKFTKWTPDKNADDVYNRSTVWKNCLELTNPFSTYLIFVASNNSSGEATGLKSVPNFNGELELHIHYSVYEPEIVLDDDFARKFTIHTPTVYSRQLQFSFPGGRAIKGTRTPNDAKLTYTISQGTKMLWQQQQDGESYGQVYPTQDTIVTFETIEDLFYPKQYGITPFQYTLTLQYDKADTLTFNKQIAAPPPTVWKYPQIIIRLPGEDRDLTGEQEEMHQSMPQLTGDSFSIWWTDPEIRYAEKLHINFQILISRIEPLNNQVTDNMIFQLQPMHRIFPNMPSVIKYRKDFFKTFFWYTRSEAEDTPFIPEGSALPHHDQQDEGDESEMKDYVYSYTFTKEALRKFATDLDKLFICVRPIIVYENNLEAENFATGTDMHPEANWVNSTFIFANGTTCHFCTDEYWDEQQGKVVLGDEQWRRCVAYYCPDGLRWVTVAIHWSGDGTKWSFC